MSANPAQVPVNTSDQSPSTVPFPSSTSSANAVQDPQQSYSVPETVPRSNIPTSAANLNQSSLNALTNSTSNAGASSLPSSTPAIDTRPAVSPREGTKSKPIVIEEKEEGEISDDDVIEVDPVAKPTAQVSSTPVPIYHPPSPAAVRATPSHNPHPPVPVHLQTPQFPPAPFTMLASNNGRPLTKTQRKKQERRVKAQMNAQRKQNQQYHQPQYGHPYAQSPSSSSTIPSYPKLPSPPAEEKGKGKEKEREDEAEVSLELNETVAPAAANMSPEEVEQYIDIIRNLISEGVSPDTLVQRGASPEYVMKVCKEIVEGTRKRKALWLETREPPRAESEAPSLPPPEPVNKSPSPEIEVVTVHRGGIPGLKRVKSDDSDDSNLYDPVPRMTAPQNGLASRLTAKLAQPVRIESYKPGQPSRPSSQAFSYPAVPIQPSGRSKRKERDSNLSAGSDILLNYDEPVKESHPPAPPKPPPLATRLGTANPYSVLDTIPLTPPFSPPPIVKAMVQSEPRPEPTAPPPPAPPPLTAEQILQNTLLESRRKAMESMKRRRAAGPKPITTVVQSSVDVELSAGSTPMADDQAAADFQKSIEEQMASIEKEVLEAAAAAADEDKSIDVEETNGEDEEERMDLDEPEEGEIIPPIITTPPEPTLPPFIGSASLPIRPPRGIKRMHAEDLNENKATSLPSRTLPPAKRKPFGAVQRAQRLVLHLDDSDSDSSDEENTPTPVFIPNNDVDIIERQRMLEEKEASIRKLREQIAARMAARKKKSEDSSTGGTPMEKTPSEDTAQQIVRNALQPIEGENGSISPVPADVRQLTKELVQAEAEVEAMDVDPIPSMPLALFDPTYRLTISCDSYWPNCGRSCRRQGTNQHGQRSFTNYQPLLNRYPQLNYASLDASLLPFIQLDTASTQPSSSVIGTEGASGQIDRQLLNSIILTRLLQRNPSMVACQAEMGGGKCADRTCSDLHLDKGIVPTGKYRRASEEGELIACLEDDLVEYIGQTLSNDGIFRQGPGQIRDVLGNIRQDDTPDMESDQGLSELLLKVGQTF
uniref:Putative zinc-finger domain-containing protein n=1 Tax=Kwoniella bestiolae CBS 10118 TaxID=1296100 RepID=A0A1B9G974_9TREE|nr:hypothetical protein I302_02431 [Kwoniella bestiolae CBS 10118]OCF27588.1 hypothetical protein I302_02431 [Kwoniella bestiolae CBS 10118]